MLFRPGHPRRLRAPRAEAQVSGVYDPVTGELIGGALDFGSGGYDKLAQYTPEERELLRLNGEFFRDVEETHADGAKVTVRKRIRVGDEYASTTWRDGRMA